MARKGENIRKRKDGRWEGRYVVKMGNVSKTRSIYATTYADVKRKLAKARTENIIPHRPTEFSILVNEIAESWLNEVYSTKKESTYIKYKTVYSKYIKEKIGTMKIGDITSESICNIYLYECSESCKKSIHSVLNQIFTYGQIHYKIPDIKLDKIKCNKKEANVKTLNTSEQTKLIKYLYQDMDIYKFGIILCLNTGLRLGEVCSLKWEDIDFTSKSLHVNRTVQRLPEKENEKKTKLVELEPKTICSKREIPISDQIYELLLRYRTKDSIYVLNQNRPLDPRTYQNKFKKYLNDAGIEYHNFHVLRHTFATNCINSGTDVKSVSEILGHSDVKTTLNKYVHPSMEIKRNHLNHLDSIYGQYRGQSL